MSPLIAYLTHSRMRYHGIHGSSGKASESDLIIFLIVIGTIVVWLLIDWFIEWRRNQKFKERKRIADEITAYKSNPPTDDL